MFLQEVEMWLSPPWVEVEGDPEAGDPLQALW